MARKKAEKKGLKFFLNNYIISAISIKFNAEDYGRKPVGESVPAVGWKY